MAATQIIMHGLTDEQLAEVEERIVQRVVEAVKRIKTEELQECFLSPKEVCKLFQPSISLVTLAAWTKKGLLKMYRINGRTYYKYSEVIEAVKSLKKYHPGRGES